MPSAAKYQRYRRKCQRCGVMFGCWRPTQRWCSRKCCANDRIDHQRRAGQTAGKLSGQRQAARVLAELRATWPDAPLSALELLRTQRRIWWMAGYQAGDKRGFRRGFAAALGEAPERRHRRAA